MEATYFVAAHAVLRLDGRYNFVIGNLTLAVLDEPTLNGLGLFKDQLLSSNGASPDVFGLLALAATLTGGLVEYIPHIIQRIFGEQ